MKRTRNILLSLGFAVVLVAFGLWNRLRYTRRSRAIVQKEKDRSEELLLNILPEEVAEELKAKGSAEAVHIDQVSVLFTDFKGFTAMAERLSPKELVHDLHECFSEFDRIVEKHGIEKIKTIGDAYMAAGGLPVPNKTHATDVIKAAFEMRDFVEAGKARKIAAGLPYFEIRIGIHTGPVVAGIVGIKKFSYDIWGDTVNTPSRMESSGAVRQVNISEATYELVKNEPGLTFTPRGKVQAKGKGEMEMYFVGQIIPSIRKDKGASVEDPAAEGSATGDHRSNMFRSPIPRSSQGSRMATFMDLRILLAEDNEFNVMVAQDELMEIIPGVQVDVAHNGRIAVEMVKANTYVLVLIDVQMPEMNGYEATRAIRALPGDRARLPIIAMTANTMQAEVDRCKEAGMDGFVPKPFKREELLQCIAAVLG